MPPCTYLCSLTYCHNDNPNEGMEKNNEFDKMIWTYTIYNRFFSHFISQIHKDALRIKRNYTYMAREGRSCEPLGGYKTVNRTTLPLCHT